MADDDRQDDAVLGAVQDLSSKLDTVAGALAAIASSHTDLLAHVAEAEARRSQDAAEVAQRLDALERQVLAGGSDAGTGPSADPDQLAKVIEGIERLESRSEDRLAAIRDAALAPVADLQALLHARAEREDRDLTELTDTVRRLAAEGPAPIREQLADLRAALGELEVPEAPPDPSSALLDRLDELGQAVSGLTWRLPELTAEVTAVRERVDELDLEGATRQAADEVSSRLTLHTDTALAGVLRLIDDRLSSLRRALTEASATAAPSNVGGFEAGAVMGAAQAAWNRLEQRIDNEFDDLGRQLQAMASMIEQVSASAEAAANRPVVTGDQIRRAASAVRESVVSASRSRRERRGGPRSLGSG